MANWIKDNLVHPVKNWRSPLIQLGFWAAVAVFALLITRLAKASPEVIWSISATAVLSYSIFNALIGIFSRSWFQYFLWSALAYFFLVLICLLATRFLAVQQLDELNEFRGVYAALFLSYFMIMMVTAAIRSIAVYLKIDQMPDR